MTTTSTALQPGTGGLLLTLLTFSVAVLIGTAAGLEPETILYRAVTGGALAGAIGASVLFGLHVVAESGDEDSPG